MGSNDIRMQLVIDTKTGEVRMEALGDKFDKVGRKGKRSLGKINAAAKSVKRSLASILPSATSLVTILTSGFATKVLYDAGRSFAALETAFEAITGSAERAAVEFQFLHAVADDLGQNFYVLAESYKGYVAAAKETSLSGQQVHDIFQSLIKAAATLHMSGDQVKGMLYAITQMMSKGKVSSEELRRQLGERLYGAFQLAAQAMRVNTAELDELLRKGAIVSEVFLPRFAAVLDSKYTGKIDQATRAANKFIEAWTDIKVEMAQSGFLDSAAGALIDFTDVFKDKDVQSGMRIFAKTLGNIVGAMAKMTKFTVSPVAGFFEWALFADEPTVQKRYAKLLEGLRKKLRGLEKTTKTVQTPGGRYEVPRVQTYFGDEEKRQQEIAEIKAQIAALEKARGWTRLMELRRLEQEAAGVGGDSGGTGGSSPPPPLPTAGPDYDMFAPNWLQDMRAKVAQTESEMLKDSWFHAISDRVKQREAELAAEEKLKADRLQLVEEFSDEYIRTIHGSHEMERLSVQRQAQIWRDAGADKVKLSAWVGAEMSRIDAEEAQSARAAAEERLRASRHWVDGATRGLADYAAAATDAAANLEQVFTGGFQTMEDGLVQFATTGKLEIRDMVNSMLADIARLTIRQSITGPLSNLLGGWISKLFNPSGPIHIGAGGTTAFGMAGGGIIGEHVVGVGMRSGASYQFGEKGPEWVLPEDFMARGLANRIDPPVTNLITATPDSFAEFGTGILANTQRTADYLEELVKAGSTGDAPEKSVLHAGGDEKIPGPLPTFPNIHVIGTPPADRRPNQPATPSPAGDRPRTATRPEAPPIQVVYAPVIQAIDTQSGLQFLAGHKDFIIAMVQQVSRKNWRPGPLD